MGSITSYAKGKKIVMPNDEKELIVYVDSTEEAMAYINEVSNQLALFISNFYKQCAKILNELYPLVMKRIKNKQIVHKMNMHNKKRSKR